MKQLKFVCDRREFHPGLNVTVRVGRKWFDKLRMGDRVDVLVCQKFHEGECCPEKGCATVGQALVVGVHLDEENKAWSVPESMLQFEHAVRSRDMSGLAKALNECYPEWCVDKDPTTWIAFYLGLS